MNDENMEESEERRRDVDAEAEDTVESTTVATATNVDAPPAPPAPRNRASNLTEADRRRGGQSSARQQVRDAHGQFAGRAGKQRDGEDGKDGSRPRSRRKSR